MKKSLTMSSHDLEFIIFKGGGSKYIYYFHILLKRELNRYMRDNVRQSCSWEQKDLIALADSLHRLNGSNSFLQNCDFYVC